MMYRPAQLMLHRRFTGEQLLLFKMNYLSLYYYISQLSSLPLDWVLKLTLIRQLSSSLVLNLHQTNATDIK